MKNTIFLALAALLSSAAVHAQSTVDSIEAKYKLVPMPGALTIEQTFPAIGSYQLNSNGTDAAQNLTITLDSANKGVIWVEGLPQGRIKAYLKQSPATYRILSQKTSTGEQVSEGTLVYDSSAHTINIALGAPYNEADPTGIFAQNPNATVNTTATMTDANATTGMNANNDETKVKLENGDKTKTEVKGDNTLKVKTKTPAGKKKSKVTFYTGTKIEMNNTDQNNMQQQPQDQQQQTPAASGQQQHEQQPAAQPQHDQQPKDQQ